MALLPIPQLPDFIPGTNGEEKLNKVLEHMEKLLSTTKQRHFKGVTLHLLARIIAWSPAPAKIKLI
jgi:hypothetical protein